MDENVESQVVRHIFAAGNGKNLKLRSPRNSTQLISTSALSPSADNGTSSRRLRSTKGPVSGAVSLRFCDPATFCPDILRRAVSGYHKCSSACHSGNGVEAMTCLRYVR
jgi:hypothetical protein